MARLSRLQFLGVAVVFHLLYIGSIFDTYFVSPVINGMNAYSVETPEPPAKRVVLFVVCASYTWKLEMVGEVFVRGIESWDGVPTKVDSKDKVSWRGITGYECTTTEYIVWVYSQFKVRPSIISKQVGCRNPLCSDSLWIGAGICTCNGKDSEPWLRRSSPRFGKVHSGGYSAARIC